MDATIIANINDARSRSNFLTSQKILVDDFYNNYNSYLYNAQQVSNGYMSMKQRVPMVLEYYQTPDELYTIEMYINPNSLSFSHQKLIAKQYTRGGIFFHHYGEDAPTINIEGHSGLAGMVAIEQLEHIFNYSGTLLRYQNVGINKINNGLATPREILSYTGTFNFNDNESSGLVADVAATYDTLLQNNATESEIANTISTIEQKINNEINKLNTPANQLATAQSIVKAMSVLKKTIGEFDTRKDFSNILTQTTDELEKIQKQDKSKITFTVADIFDVAKKIVKKVTKADSSLNDSLRESYAFQVAWQIYINLTKESMLQEALEKQTNYEEVTKAINSTSYYSNNTTAQSTTNKYTGLQDNTQYTLDTSKATTQSVPMCDEYTCTHACSLYKEPSFNSEKIQDLVVDGRFSAKCGTTADGNWIEHIDGGFAPLKTSGYVLLTKDTIPESAQYLYKTPGNYNDKFSNTPLSSSAIFTYTESKAVSGITWFKHKNGGWAVEGAFNMDYSVPQFFKLEYSNCYRFTIIRDDVMLYKDPMDNSELFREEPCYKGALFTATELKGNWAHWINGGWIRILNADGTYNVSGFNDASTDELSKSDNSNMLTSNNDITLRVQEVIDDCTTELQKYIRDVRVWAKNSVIKRFEIESGLSDIMDELTDQWLPRLIFIYFEDRVFIGHFNDFKYSRVAETDDIKYNMSFTIHRIISVTSIDPDRFEQNAQLNNDVENFPNQIEENVDYLQAEYMNGNDIPLKVEILRTRCKFRIEKMIANYTGVPMTTERQETLHNYAVSLRAMSIYNGKQQITEDTPIYGNTELSYEQFLCFMKIQYESSYNSFNFPTQLKAKIASAEYAQKELELDRKINGEPVTLDMLKTSYFLPKYDEVIELEMQRTLSIWNNEKNKVDLYTTDRKKELVDHATNILTSIGARFKDYNDFKSLLNNVLYEYNITNNTSINPYNTTQKNTVSTADAFNAMKNTMTSYIQYFLDNKKKIIGWIEEYLSNNKYSIPGLAKYLQQKIQEEQASAITQKITDEKTEQIDITNGIYYNDFINSKSINVFTTTIINVYDIKTIDGVSASLEILYKTNDITIQVNDVKGRYGYVYKQITIIPNTKNTKNDIYLQLYDENNLKIQENRIKIIT